MKILGSVKSLPRVKNNETITKILKKSRFWLCNRNETVYTNYITGSKEASEARPEARFGADAVRGWAAFRTVSF